MSVLEIVLLSIFVAREILFHYQVNKLMDKLMSKNLYEYELSKTVGKEGSRKIKAAPTVTEDHNEDLGVLSGIG